MTNIGNISTGSNIKTENLHCGLSIPKQQAENLAKTLVNLGGSNLGESKNVRTGESQQNIAESTISRKILQQQQDLLQQQAAPSENQDIQKSSEKKPEITDPNLTKPEEKK